MKKRILSLLLLGIMTCSLAACGNTDPTSGQNAGFDAEIGNNTNSVNNSVSESGMYFWYNQQTWDTPKGSFEGGLFNEHITLPIDLSTIDACSAPYRYFPEYASYDDYSNNLDDGHGKNVDSIKDILSDEYAISLQESDSFTSSTTIIYTQHETEESDTDVVSDNIQNIYILNFDEKGNALPLSTCYENGWWFIDFSDPHDPEPALMLDEYGEDMTLMDAIVAKFGTPNYVNINLGTKEDFLNDLSINDGYITYSFIYEYPEFTLEISFSEMIMSEYDSETHEMYGLRYYPASCWEKAKDLMNLEIIEPSSNTTASAPSNQTTDSSDSAEFEWYFNKVTPTHQTASPYPFSNFSGDEDKLTAEEIWTPGENVWDLQNVSAFRATRKKQDDVIGTWEDIKDSTGPFYSLSVYSNVEYSGEPVVAGGFEIVYPEGVDSENMTLEETITQGYWHTSGMSERSIYAGHLSDEFSKRGTGAEQMDTIISVWGQPSEVYYTLVTEPATDDIDVTFTNTLFVYDCGDYYFVFEYYETENYSNLNNIHAYGKNAKSAIGSYYENLMQR